MVASKCLYLGLQVLLLFVNGHEAGVAEYGPRVTEVLARIFGRSHGPDELMRYFELLDGSSAQSGRYGSQLMRIINAHGDQDHEDANVASIFGELIPWLASLKGLGCSSQVCGLEETGCPPEWDTKPSAGNCKPICKLKRYQSNSSALQKGVVCPASGELCPPCWYPSDCPMPRQDEQCDPKPRCQRCPYGQYPPGVAHKSRFKFDRSLLNRSLHHDERPGGDDELYMARNMDRYVERVLRSRGVRARRALRGFLASLRAPDTKEVAAHARALLAMFENGRSRYAEGDQTRNIQFVMGNLLYRLHRVQCRCEEACTLQYSCPCEAPRASRQAEGRYKQGYKAPTRALGFGELRFMEEALRQWKVGRFCISCDYRNYCQTGPRNFDHCTKWPACPLCKKPIVGGDVRADDPALDLYHTDYESPAYESPARIEVPAGWRARTRACGLAPMHDPTPRKTARSSGARMAYATAAVHGQFPWFVLLKRLNALNKPDQLCGGTLVSDRHVLTAAHCMRDEPQLDRYQILYNDVHLELGDHLSVGVKSVRTAARKSRMAASCPAGRRDNWADDWALLTLKEPVNMTASVQFACLPSERIELDSERKTPVCYDVGAGYALLDTPQHGLHMGDTQTIRFMPVVPGDCNLFAISNADLTRQCWVTALDEGNPCPGDSGGPVACWASTASDPIKRWYIVGVNSISASNCRTDNSFGPHFITVRVRGILAEMLASSPD